MTKLCDEDFSSCHTRIPALPSARVACCIALIIAVALGLSGCGSAEERDATSKASGTSSTESELLGCTKLSTEELRRAVPGITEPVLDAGWIPMSGDNYVIVVKLASGSPEVAAWSTTDISDDQNTVALDARAAKVSTSSLSSPAHRDEVLGPFSIEDLGACVM